jgi:type III secretion protein L
MGGVYRLKQLDFVLPAASHILSYGEAEALQEATGILEAAEAEATRIRGDAKSVYKSERARGYAEGMHKADMEGLTRLIVETDLLGQRLTQLEAELAELVVACVRRIMDSFSDDEKTRLLVRSALKRMRREKRVELHVPPAKAEEARTIAAGLVKEFPEIDLVEVIEEAALEPHKLTVESPIGRIAVDLDGGLEHLRGLRYVPFPQQEDEKHD